MKNIHLLPTEKPSRLCIHNSCNELNYFEVAGLSTEHIINQHIYITSDEEIKEGDYVYSIKQGYNIQKVPKGLVKSYQEVEHYKKIILTTDQDLIADGTQSIEDEFLQWLVKNPSREFVEINIPQEEPKQETLEEAADNWVRQPIIGTKRESFIAGAQWMQEQMEKLKDFETWKEWKNS